LNKDCQRVLGNVVARNEWIRDRDLANIRVNCRHQSEEQYTLQIICVCRIEETSQEFAEYAVGETIAIRFSLASM
jgi:hypothetical protein